MAAAWAQFFSSLHKSNLALSRNHGNLLSGPFPIRAARVAPAPSGHHHDGIRVLGFLPEHNDGVAQCFFFLFCLFFLPVKLQSREVKAHSFLKLLRDGDMAPGGPSAPRIKSRL